ncbi:hypothetical protein phiOC_p155 [Ochrobactrum phage vB_OspM_OC]|nr:hypothetical protein phiOC_p155 [Ochrobactrum phage vB_OspM_OC]
MCKKLVFNKYVYSYDTEIFRLQRIKDYRAVHRAYIIVALNNNYSVGLIVQGTIEHPNRLIYDRRFDIDKFIDEIMKMDRL